MLITELLFDGAFKVTVGLTVSTVTLRVEVALVFPKVSLTVALK